MKTEEELNIIGFGMLPCLHCGEVIKMDGEIHLCDAPKEEWLNNQKIAVMEMFNGDLWDLKNKNMIKKKQEDEE